MAEDATPVRLGLKRGWRDGEGYRWGGHSCLPGKSILKGDGEMMRIRFSSLVILALIQFTLVVALSPPSLAQEWKFQVKRRGTLKAVELGNALVESIYF